MKVTFTPEQQERMKAQISALNSRVLSTANRNGRTIDFTVHHWELNSHISPIDETSLKPALKSVMESHGYHPAGYGGPFEIKETEYGYTFKCSGSSD